MNIDLSILIPVILLVFSNKILKKFGYEQMFAQIIYTVIVLVIAILLNINNSILPINT